MLLKKEYYLIPVRDMVVFPDSNTMLIAGRSKSILAVEKAYINNENIFCITQRDKNLENISSKDDLFEIGDAKFIPRDTINNPELRSEKFSVQQGMLELSNSNVIREMINTINTTRNYESLTKVVSTNSEMLTTAVSLGRIRNS